MLFKIIPGLQINFLNNNKVLKHYKESYFIIL